MTCPYCFDQFAAKEIAFRCGNPSPAQCKLELDATLARYTQSPPVQKQRVFVPTRFFFGRPPRHARCSCGYESIRRLCPKCHNELPAEFGDLQNFTVALIGAKETGKSNYIGVLVNRLANEVGAAFQAALNASDDITPRRYNQDFKRYIFDHRQVIPGTISAGANPDVRYPLNYRFSLNSKGFLRNPRAIALSLFDTAGEDLDTDDSTMTHARYVLEADALIFLLDPLQIPAVRDQIGSSIPLPSQRTDPVDIVARAMRIIRKKKGGRRIRVPVAVAFSKIDAVRTLVEPNSPIHIAPQHRGYYDESDGLRLHESMRSYLAQWGGGGLAIDNTMRNEFERYRYFGLSSFGYAPVNNDLARGVNPFRVEDPFLWLLAEAGFVEKRTEGSS